MKLLATISYSVGNTKLTCFSPIMSVKSRKPQSILITFLSLLGAHTNHDDDEKEVRGTRLWADSVAVPRESKIKHLFERLSGCKEQTFPGSSLHIQMLKVTFFVTFTMLIILLIFMQNKLVAALPWGLGLIGEDRGDTIGASVIMCLCNSTHGQKRETKVPLF